jgi:hypothetical protein
MKTRLTSGNHRVVAFIDEYAGGGGVFGESETRPLAGHDVHHDDAAVTSPSMSGVKRRGPRITLIPPDPSATLDADLAHLDVAAQERVIALAPFVGGVRNTFARQWPAQGVEQGRPGHYTRTYPFPDCWPLHSELVTEFHLRRQWTTVIESGEIEPAAYGGEYDRWSRHVREVTVAMVREISQLCMATGATKHVDPMVPRPGFGPPTRTQVSGASHPAGSWRRAWAERGPHFGGMQ